MKSTLNKIIEIANTNNELANNLVKKLYQEFTAKGTSELILVLKNLIKYSSVDTWLKNEFLKEKSYTLEVDSNGNINHIRINKKFTNPDNIDEHYYIDAKIAPTFAIIHGGNHYSEMNQVIASVDDMENLLNIKIFEN